MSPEEIRVDDPEEIKSWMQATVSFIEEYRNTLGDDLRAFDDVSQLCEMAKQAVLARHEELSEEEQQTPSQDGESRSRIQQEIDGCRETMTRLVQYSEEIEGFKRDTSGALSRVQAIFDDASGLKGRVDALMNSLIDSR